MTSVVHLGSMVVDRKKTLISYRKIGQKDEVVNGITSNTRVFRRSHYTNLYSVSDSSER